MFSIVKQIFLSYFSDSFNNKNQRIISGRNQANTFLFPCICYANPCRKNHFDAIWLHRWTLLWKEPLERSHTILLGAWETTKWESMRVEQKFNTQEYHLYAVHWIIWMGFYHKAQGHSKVIISKVNVKVLSKWLLCDCEQENMSL